MIKSKKWTKLQEITCSRKLERKQLIQQKSFLHKNNLKKCLIYLVKDKKVNKNRKVKLKKNQKLQKIYKNRRNLNKLQKRNLNFWRINNNRLMFKKINKNQALKVLNILNLNILTVGVLIRYITELTCNKK